MGELSPYLDERIGRGPTCWAWLGYVAPNGYGVANLPGGRRMSAHRAVYEAVVGPIPAGQHLDHQCHNRDASCRAGKACLHRRCVNPDHLEPTTPRENIVRGRTTPAANLAKKQCPNGHDYDYTDPRGWRKCSICANAKAEGRRRAAGVKPSTAGSPECKKGHPFTPDNIRWSFGKRYCKECDRLNSQKWNEKVRRPCRGCGGPKGPGKRRVYCDECQHRRGRRRSTGPTRDVVDAVYDRASHSCELCAAGLGPVRGVDHHLHHRRPRAMGGTDRPDTNLPSNLLLLCPPCHEDVESRRGDALLCGRLLSQVCDPAATAVRLAGPAWRYLTDDGRYSNQPPKERR